MEVFHILFALILSLFFLLHKIIAEKNELLEDWEIVQTENLNLKTLFHEMRSRVDCQLCFVSSRRGPVPMCPKGHFICSSCKARNMQEGKTHCPTCLWGRSGPFWPILSLRTCCLSKIWRAVGRWLLTVDTRNIRTAVTLDQTF